MTAVLFSLAPMIQVSKLEIFESVKKGAAGVAGGRDGLRSALVIGQLTLGLVLLSGASLLAAAFLKLEGRDPGFRADHLLKFNVSLPDAQYTTAKQIAFDDRLIERLNTIPGVESAASGWPLPFERDQVTVSFDIQERRAPAPERPSADMAIVTPEFFHTLGIPLLRGRAFSNRDDANAQPVVMVNQAFAERLFPGEGALGKRIQSGATFGNKGTVMETIVGIVANARQSALAPESEPIYYFPYRQLSWGFGWTVLRASVPPRNVESAVRAAVASVDPQVPVYDVGTMEEFFSTAIVQPRIHMWLLGSLAVIAMLLITVGLYGVMAYSVTRRTREIGVRIAVGATRGTILQMIFGHAAILILLGTSFGVAVARLCDGVLKRLLYGVQLDTWLLLAACCVAIAFTGAIATYLPARRAASIDPVQALRVE